MEREVTIKMYALNRRNKNGDSVYFEEIALSRIKTALARYVGYDFKVTKLEFKDVPLEIYTNTMSLDALCIAPMKTNSTHAEVALFSKIFTKDCLFEDVALPCTQNDVVYELVATLKLEDE